MCIILRQPYSFCQQGHRSNQEDARYPDCDAPAAATSTFVVCDGVGGQDKGEVASRTVADAMGTYMNSRNAEKNLSVSDFAAVLAEAFRCLERKMNADTRDMATTMTFVHVNADSVLCAHIGDSRIYHVRPGIGIMYRSDDHSLVNALVHSGNLTPQEAINHPQSNVITRCIGYVPKGNRKPDATTIRIEDVAPGDYFFMCTDGVLHKMADDDLVEILSSDVPDKEKIARIARMSKDSSDNNTAYLIGVETVTADNTVAEVEDCPEWAGAATAPLQQPGAMSKEVAPDKNSTGGRVSGFFKKLFG